LVDTTIDKRKRTNNDLPIIIILYLPKEIQFIGIYTYNQYKNIFIAEHDN